MKIWTEDFVQQRERFSYTNNERTIKVNTGKVRYKNREEALKSALEFREELVKQGKIILSNQERNQDVTSKEVQAPSIQS